MGKKGKTTLLIIALIMLSTCLFAKEPIKEELPKKEFSLGVNVGAVSGIGLSARIFNEKNGLQFTIGGWGSEKSKEDGYYKVKKEFYDFGLQVMHELRKYEDGRFYMFGGGMCLAAESKRIYKDYKKDEDPFSLEDDDDKLAVVTFGGGVGFEHKFSGPVYMIAEVPVTFFASFNNNTVIGVVPISIQLGLMYKF